MAELRTDDAVRRLRAVWLGPDRFRLPVDWTYVEWAAVLGLTVTLTPSIGLAVFALLGDGFASIFAGLLFGGLGAYLRGVATRLVDPDRSVRYWRTVVAGELRLPRLHRHTSPWRPVIATLVVFVVARVGVAVLGGRLPVWLLITGLPVWLMATRVVDRFTRPPFDDGQVLELTVPTVQPAPLPPPPPPPPEVVLPVAVALAVAPVRSLGALGKDFRS